MNRHSTLKRIGLKGIALLAATLLEACTITGVRQAPVTERGPAVAASPETSTPPAAAREARDGIYIVQKGDTLFNIAAAFGRDHRDLARWNGIDDPNRLSVGQALRVIPPVEAAVATPVTPAGGAQLRPLAPPVASAVPAPGATNAPPAPAGDQPPPAVAAAPAEKGMIWAWPVAGKVLEKFDEKRNKGIDIAAREGDAVLAAGDGSVVYSGSGLRGYGNLVIVKHDDQFISAYAHNRQILVKQGDAVKRGQRIAEAGKSDARTPKLHFEIRRGGKPVDPLQYLPPR